MAQRASKESRETRGSLEEALPRATLFRRTIRSRSWVMKHGSRIPNAKHRPANCYLSLFILFILTFAFVFPFWPIRHEILERSRCQLFTYRALLYKRIEAKKFEFLHPKRITCIFAILCCPFESINYKDKLDLIFSVEFNQTTLCCNKLVQKTSVKTKDMHLDTRRERYTCEELILFCERKHRSADATKNPYPSESGLIRELPLGFLRTVHGHSETLNQTAFVQFL